MSTARMLGLGKLVIGTIFASVLILSGFHAILAYTMYENEVTEYDIFRKSVDTVFGHSSYRKNKLTGEEGVSTSGLFRQGWYITWSYDCRCIYAATKNGKWRFHDLDSATVNFYPNDRQAYIPMSKSALEIAPLLEEAQAVFNRIKEKYTADIEVEQR